MTDHKHESVGVFSRGPCDAPRVSICACGATQKVGSGTWTAPPNPRSFDTIPPEQRAELLAFAEWLKLPKPKMTFEVYRAEHLPPPSETKLTEALDDWERSFVDFVKWCTDPEFELRDSDREGINFGAVRLARSSLESLYRELWDEMETLALAVRVVNEELLEARAALDRQRSEDAAYDLEEMLNQSAELGRLRSLQLTPRQASALRYITEDTGIPPEGLSVEEIADTLEKLRRISSKATSEEL